MLDAGLSANISPGHIFVTHGHSDHSCNLPFHLYSTKEDQRIQVYVPAESLKYFRDYIGAAYSITTEKKFDENLSCGCDIIPVEIEQTKRKGYIQSILSNYFTDKLSNIILEYSETGRIPLIINKKSIDVEIIKCYHSIPCVGYGFTEKRKRLKNEYVNLPGKDIAALRKTGIEVSRDVDIPFFCYLGDTSQEVLKDPKLLKYSTIQIECTFLLPTELEQAYSTRHMHIDHLKPFIIAHPEITFILYHFSQRYQKAEIAEFFTRLDIKNIIPWIN